MAEFYGGDYIYQSLNDSSGINSLVGTSIYNARVIPSTESSYDTINFYITSNINSALEYFESNWSIDCRSQIESYALDIAIEVVNTLNRVYNTTGGKGYFGTCTVLPVIPPLNEHDCYNVPVQFLLRRR